MKVTNGYYKKAAKGLTTRGQRRLRRHIRCELLGCQRDIKSRLASEFQGKKLDAALRPDVQAAIAEVMQARVDRPLTAKDNWQDYKKSELGA